MGREETHDRQSLAKAEYLGEALAKERDESLASSNEATETGRRESPISTHRPCESL